LRRSRWRVAGAFAVRATPVDALPDLSDVQVVVRTTYPGQAPQIVENQITYPLSATMLSVPGARSVRGYSFFGDSFVYVIFDEGVDLYWARSRVLEYLMSQARAPARSCTFNHRPGRDGGSVGSISTRWSIAQAATISANCAVSRTGC
jgi:Cu/Ag efflux pump CusA